MSIYVGEHKATLYKGDYAPAEFYKGGTKMTGWELENKTGQDITFENTYNCDFDKLEMQGETTQATMPTPNNPVPLVDIGELVTDVSSPNYGKYAFNVSMKGKNLFDKSKLVMGRWYDYFNAGAIDPPRELAFYNLVGVRSIHPDNAVPTKGGVTYTFRNPISDLMKTHILELDADKKEIYSDTSPISQSLPVLTFTTQANTRYLGIQLSNNLATTGTPLTPEQLAALETAQFQLELSSAPTSYAPYFDTLSATYYADEPLRSVLQTTDTTTPEYSKIYWDYIDVSDNSVTFVNRIAAIDCTNISWAVRTNGNLWQNNTCAFTPVNWSSYNIYLAANGFCSHFRQFGNVQSIYPSGWYTTGCFAMRTSYRMLICPTMAQIGATSEDTQAECLIKFTAWLASESTEGRPVTVYAARSTPITTDLTDTDFGQAILQFKSKYPWVNLTSNAILDVTTKIVDN